MADPRRGRGSELGEADQPLVGEGKSVDTPLIGNSRFERLHDDVDH